MPFKEAITHEGVVDPDEILVVVTTRGRYRFSVRYVVRGRVKQKEFYIPRRYWPAAVKRAAKELCDERRRRGTSHDLANVIARLPLPEPHLATGQTGIDVLVEYESMRAPRKIPLKGTITGFEYT